MTDSSPKTLASLVAEVPGARIVRGSPETLVQSLEYDSRQAGPGSMFVAVPGFVVDGHSFLAQGAGAGAAPAVVQADRLDALSSLPDTLALISDPDTRPVLHSAAAWIYAQPGR